MKRKNKTKNRENQNVAYNKIIVVSINRLGSIKRTIYFSYQTRLVYKLRKQISVLRVEISFTIWLSFCLFFAALVSYSVGYSSCLGLLQ